MPFPSTLLPLLALATTAPASEDSDGWTPAKKTAAAAVDAREELLTRSSLAVWELAELALKEVESAEIVASLVRDAGFEVTSGTSGMPTAFVATWGAGKPVIAFLSEFDALPGLSQRVTAQVEALVPGAGGHGCGHNLFGVASAGAAIGLKQAMEAHGLRGTIRLFGTPAEEQGLGKVFMVRDGLFDDVDAVLSWHPSNKNEVKVQASKALRSFEVTFHGRSAHASGAPWEGVSALDAVEAFGTGVNLLREHIPETARIHYVITEGGAAPNVIPARARLWAYVRGKDWPEQQKVFRHVVAIVEGADRMAWGEEYGRPETGFRPAEVVTYTGLYEYNVSLGVAQRMQRNLELVGAPAFTEEEQRFGKDLQRAFGLDPSGFATTVRPFAPKAPPTPGGSTDVANISWVAPTADLSVATWPMTCPAHSWASTSASGSDAAQRAMIVAAKVLACTGVEFLSDPAAVPQVRAELEKSRETFDYEPPVGPKDKPSLPTHMRE